MGILDTVQRIDEFLLWLLNVKLTAGFLDQFMPWITDPGNFKLPLLIGLVLLLVFGRPRDRWTILLCIVALAISNFFVESLKHTFERIRPCHEFDWVRTLRGCGRTYSMPSGHTANIFAVMGVLSVRYRRLRYPFLLFALLIGWSRVYVGVHYPTDVLAGIALGIGVAWVVLFSDRRLTPHLKEWLKGLKKRLKR